MSKIELIPVARLSDLDPGTCFSIEVKGRGIALFNVAGEIYALDNTCPHAGGPLGDGTLHDDIVECPWHGWQFNVRTGERVQNSSFQVACYRVEVTGELISLAVPTESPDVKLC